MTVADAIREVAHRHERDPFLVDAATGSIFRYGEAIDEAARLRGTFERLGLHRGDRLAFLSDSSIELALAYFGALMAGVTIVPLGPSLGADDLAHVLRSVRPARLVVSRDLAGAAAALPSDLRPPVSTLSLDQRHASIDGSSGPPVDDGLAAVHDGDVFSITFTSGSTAFPKGVIHTVGSLFGNAIAFDQLVGSSPRDRLMHLLPMSYMAGLLNSLVCPFMAGASVVVGPAFAARTVLDFWTSPIERDVTSFWVAPTMLAMLLAGDRDRRAPGYVRSSVRRIFVGTAALTPVLKARFEAVYEAPLSPSYGTSELLLITVNLPERGHRDDSVGIALPEVDVELRDIADGVGEIGVRTPFSFTGYVGEPPVASAEMVHLTGDLGILLPGDELIVTGRKKDLIISGGVNVSPPAVERVIELHPAVEACAVVGLPHEILGEAVVAAVQLVKGTDIARIRASLAQHAAMHLGPAQRPSRFVAVEDLPRTETGKVKRSALREALLRAAPS